MEPEQAIETQEIKEKSNFHKVTPLSKYLAMVLFILMPFVGGWIGYKYTPEKVVEVERVVIKEVQKEIYQDLESEDKIITATTSANDGELINSPGPTFIEISEYYYVSENEVYWWGPVLGVNLFSAYPEYELSKLPEADPNTFESTIVQQFDVSQGNTYQKWIARDKSYVYYRDQIIVDADPSTYRVGENVSINYDADHVFLWHEIIPEADPNTYEIILDTSAGARGTVHGRDENNCYTDYKIVSCEEEPFSL